MSEYTHIEYLQQWAEEYYKSEHSNKLPHVGESYDGNQRQWMDGVESVLFWARGQCHRHEDEPQTESPELQPEQEHLWPS